MSRPRNLPQRRRQSRPASVLLATRTSAGRDARPRCQWSHSCSPSISAPGKADCAGSLRNGAAALLPARGRRHFAESSGHPSPEAGVGRRSRAPLEDAVAWTLDRRGERRGVRSKELTCYRRLSGLPPAPFKLIGHPSGYVTTGTPRAYVRGPTRVCFFSADTVYVGRWTCDTYSCLPR
ncbi:hypothetical protein BD311DRAFT_246446 [Dichomitus squalens]|uniref:Uncharacterized protein n=1 Tax=Dichomitus squalens TaxID=114155 RepID=A0A4Q9MU69_9APHY|nr:hypothetical protein BD311DRAFT_246446 [Dichomitus squalens]